MQKVKLREIACYSETRIELSNLTKDNYVGTDNLLQNKEGKVLSNYLLSKGRTTEYLENDILIANIRPYLRKIWFATNHGGSSADVLTIRTHAAEFDSKFIYYSLFQDSFFNYVMSGAKGSKMPRGDKNQVMNFEIPNVPLPTQQKIAGVLSALDDKIALNKRESARLEVLARAIYDYWFVQFDFPDSEGKPYKASGGQMVLSEELKREIPAGWEVGNLINSPLHSVIKTGIAKFANSRKYFDTKQIGENGILGEGELVEFANRAARANMQPAKNSIWFAKMKDSVKQVFFGDMEDELLDGIFSTGMFGILAKDFAFSYLTSFIKFSDFESTKNDLSHGATQQAVNNQDISQIKFAIPSDEVLVKFDTQVRPLFDKIQRNAQESHRLAQLRDWLLPMLMNGQALVE